MVYRTLDTHTRHAHGHSAGQGSNHARKVAKAVAERERDSLPTIFQVAETAGVSITTVSHVFSGKRPVHPATRRRVLEASERLGYQARRNARGLATGRTMTLGVQLPMAGPGIIFNPYFSALLPAMSEAAVALGYAFALVPPRPSRSGFIEPLVDRRGIDAAILIDPRPHDPFPMVLLEADIPFVSLGRIPDLPDNPRVDQDFDAAVRTVLDHLHEHRYRRPAFLTIPDDLSSVQDIRRAFEHRASPRSVVVAKDFSDDAARIAAQKLLAKPARPDAVICLTERQAIGVYRAAANLGLEIPKDLGVVSFGESGVARGLKPPATSVSVFPEQSGQAVVQLVDKCLASEPIPPLTLVPTELLVRASTLRSPA